MIVENATGINTSYNIVMAGVKDVCFPEGSCTYDPVCLYDRICTAINNDYLIKVGTGLIISYFLFSYIFNWYMNTGYKKFCIHEKFKDYEFRKKVYDFVSLNILMKAYIIFIFYVVILAIARG